MPGSGINLYPYYKSAGILSALKKINYSAILNGAQKTLNVVNQAMPIVYQVKPIIKNAKTVFKIIGAVKNDKGIKNSYNTYNSNKTQIIRETKDISTNYNNTNKPNFFI